MINVEFIPKYEINTNDKSKDCVKAKQPRKYLKSSRKYTN